MNPFELLDKSITGLALVLPRLGAAFLVLPLLTSDIVPAMVRNVLVAAIALNVFPMVAPTLDMNAIGAIGLPLLIGKEIFLGIMIGFSFSILFWAIEMAGQVIDTKVGATMAQIVDPLMGHQTSLTGSVLGRFAGWLFVATGGLMVFLDVVLTSYAVWPVSRMWPDFNAVGQGFIIDRVQQLMVLTLLLAAPALVLMTVVDLGMGFMNRYAPNLNVFALSMPVKAVIAVWVIMLMMPTVAAYTRSHLSALANLMAELNKAL